MAALHDMTCSYCGVEFLNLPVDRAGTRCNCMGGRLEILWRTSYQRDASVHSKERTALLYSAKEKKFSYPGRNDQPIPDRLRKRGYERVELPSLHAVEQHEKQTNTRSHMAWWDRGSGRSPDGD